MDKMVFGFPDAQTRNVTGRAVHIAGYDCLGSGPSSINGWAFLIIDECVPRRQTAVAQLVRRTAPDANRLR